ncbi:hypothetical protein [Diplocloster modestus]|uniref:Uncharacterized protein n=1 Tax=Diplocloster modestus TaxID=2850322 RepID=A0ABS6K316_9FIRM|nr:hypothetical protein [Diplocloster modestus]MBU9724911.1 hypothetical protein [Diplocloster modestus]
MPVGKGSIQRANQIAKEQDLKTEEKVVEKPEGSDVEVAKAEVSEKETAVSDKKEGTAVKTVAKAAETAAKAAAKPVETAGKAAAKPAAKKPAAKKPAAKKPAAAKEKVETAVTQPAEKKSDNIHEKKFEVISNLRCDLPTYLL